MKSLFSHMNQISSDIGESCLISYEGSSLPKMSELSWNLQSQMIKNSLINSEIIDFLVRWVRVKMLVWTSNTYFLHHLGGSHDRTIFFIR